LNCSIAVLIIVVYALRHKKRVRHLTFSGFFQKSGGMGELKKLSSCLSRGSFILSGIKAERVSFTLPLHKYLVQKRFAHAISGHQETVAHFQDLTLCSIRFSSLKMVNPAFY